MLHANDVVEEGDATNSFLSADILASLPDAIVRQGCELLNAQFPNQPREVVQARLSAFVERYLSHRYGEELAVDEPFPSESDASADEAALLDLCATEAG